MGAIVYCTVHIIRTRTVC